MDKNCCKVLASRSYICTVERLYTKTEAECLLRLTEYTQLWNLDGKLNVLHGVSALSFGENEICGTDIAHRRVRFPCLWCSETDRNNSDVKCYKIKTQKQPWLFLFVLHVLEKSEELLNNLIKGIKSKVSANCDHRHIYIWPRKLFQTGNTRCYNKHTGIFKLFFQKFIAVPQAPISTFSLILGLIWNNQCHSQPAKTNSDIKLNLYLCCYIIELYVFTEKLRSGVILRQAMNSEM